MQIVFRIVKNFREQPVGVADRRVVVILHVCMTGDFHLGEVLGVALLISAMTSYEPEHDEMISFPRHFLQESQELAVIAPRRRGPAFFIRPASHHDSRRTIICQFILIAKPPGLIAGGFGYVQDGNRIGQGFSIILVHAGEVHAQRLHGLREIGVALGK